MDLPDDLKPDLHRTLLGPLSLADEIYGALIPGCIFSLLLLVKGRWTSTLAYPSLGYKTKVGCVLLASYLFGKVALSVVNLIESLGAAVFKKLISQENTEQPPKDPSIWYLAGKLLGSSKPIKLFTMGFIMNSLFVGKTRLFEFYSAHKASVLFYLSTGVMFISASTIPGDGSFRWLELAIGVILLARGLNSKREDQDMVAVLLGVMAGSAVGELNSSQIIGGLSAGSTLLTLLRKPLSTLTKDQIEKAVAAATAVSGESAAKPEPADSTASANVPATPTINSP